MRRRTEPVLVLSETVLELGSAATIEYEYEYDEEKDGTRTRTQ